MAEESIISVADRILEMMSSEDLKMCAKIWHLADEFVELERTISTLRDLLFDAVWVLWENEQAAKPFLEKLENAIYAADEFLDHCFVVALGRARLRSSRNKNIVFRWKMRSSMKKVKEVLDKALFTVTSQFNNLKTGMAQSKETATPEPFQVEQHAEQVPIIGRFFDRWKVMQLALEEADVDDRSTSKQKLRVVPIVGIHGIGKTSLAQFIYNQEAVKERFKPRMWVQVSRLAGLRLIMQNLISRLSAEDHETVLDKGDDNLPMGQLQTRFREMIKGKRFFLVLDDVRDKDREHWLSLKNLLAGAAEDSTVLVTTRSEQVANLTRTVAQSHRLGPLEAEEPWLLFKREAFDMQHQEESSSVQDQSEKTGREIAEMCNGIPGVLLVAGKMVCQSPASQWKKLFSEDKTIQDLLHFEDKNQEEVIGRDADKEEIRNLLLKQDSENELVIISISGVEGVGKTVLAQVIFDDSQVQDYFDIRIWVSVTGNFDLKLVMEKILASVTTTATKRGGNFQTDELENLVRQEIQGKRYLLVLDDLWYQDDPGWSRLKGLLAVGAMGSSVLVTRGTTHKYATVSSTTGGQHTYELKPLDDKSSRALFMKAAFEKGQRSSISDDIEKLVTKIVSECRGIPHVIRTIGGILSSKDPEREWQSFYEEVLQKMLNEENRLAPPLKLNYDHLPYFLKPCFAYCGLFPNDYEIDVQTLVNLWISQGFIRTTSDSNLEDVGYDYFEELLQRSFFKETMRDEFDRTTKCKMQIAMCELARRVALNACATLAINGRINGTKARHVSFDFHVDASWHVRLLDRPERNIQTLILPKQSQWEVEGRSSEAVCDEVTKFKYVRMLDLHNSGIKDVPKSIGNLEHLRYLDLSQNMNILKLPKSIGKLRNLQTLKLNHCINLEKLPETVEKLVNLRNLENECCYSLTHIPRGIGELTNLRTLSEFVLSKNINSFSSLGRLEKLNELRGKLKIKNLRGLEGDATRAKLNSKRHLLSLVLIWDNTYAATNGDDCEKLLEILQPHQALRELSLIEYGGLKLSSWLRHANLVKISLSRCMKCECLQPLYHLPSITVLHVDELPELQYIFDRKSEDEQDESAGAFFNSLKELQLTNLPKLERWWKKHVILRVVEDTEDEETEAKETVVTETEAKTSMVEEEVVEETTLFPRLSKLIIEDCPILSSMPLFPHLEEVLVLKNTSWEPFKETVKVIQTPSTTSEASSSTSSSTIDIPLSKLRTLSIINMPNIGDLNMFEFLPSLRSLTLDHLVEIKTFLEGLQKATNLQVTSNLQELHIWRCAGLEDIIWIENIKSLRILSLRLCPKLTIPRESIQHITSLQNVEIEECPEVSHIEHMLQDRLYRKHNSKFVVSSGPTKIKFKEANSGKSEDLKGY